MFFFEWSVSGVLVNEVSILRFVLPLLSLSGFSSLETARSRVFFLRHHRCLSNTPVYFEHAVPTSTLLRFSTVMLTMLFDYRQKLRDPAERGWCSGVLSATVEAEGPPCCHAACSMAGQCTCQQ